MNQLTENPAIHPVCLLEHQHLIVRAEIANPPKDPEAICEWMRELVKSINMRIMMGPWAAYSDMVGNRGLTAVTIIETSHIAMHVWDEVEPAMMQLDLYSCSHLDPQQILAQLEVFEPVSVEYKFLDRKKNLTILK